MNTYKLYLCKYNETCKKAFQTKQEFNNHISAHQFVEPYLSGSKKVPEPTKDSEYSRQVRLPFKCTYELCQKGCADATSLLDHFERYHCKSSVSMSSTPTKKRLSQKHANEKDADSEYPPKKISYKRQHKQDDLMDIERKKRKDTSHSGRIGRLEMKSILNPIQTSSKQPTNKSTRDKLAQEEPRAYYINSVNAMNDNAFDPMNQVSLNYNQPLYSPLMQEKYNPYYQLLEIPYQTMPSSQMHIDANIIPFQLSDSYSQIHANIPSFLALDYDIQRDPINAVSKPISVEKSKKPLLPSIDSYLSSIEDAPFVSGFSKEEKDEIFKGVISEIETKKKQDVNGDNGVK